MTWIVGIDFRRTARGALHYASWLAERSHHSEDERLVGIHVLEPDLLRNQLRYHHLDEVVNEATRAAGALVEREGLARSVRELLVLPGLRAEDGLVEACDRWQAHGVIIGRVAERRSHRLVRLGPVARRLVRGVRRPMVVVPPDMRERDFGDGAVVALSELTEESAEACRFAGLVARRLARRLVVAMVVAPRRAASWQDVVSASSAELPPSHRGGGELLHLQDWAASRGLRPDETLVVDAEDSADEAIELAARWRAPLLAVGGTHLRGLDRLIAPGTARALAARARCPVAVVPARA